MDNVLNSINKTSINNHLNLINNLRPSLNFTCEDENNSLVLVENLCGKSPQIIYPLLIIIYHLLVPFGKFAQVISILKKYIN